MPKVQPMLSALIYTSRLVDKTTEIELQDLVLLAALNNKYSNITGILFLKGRKVIQYIEGDANEISQLWSKIKLDSRHNILKCRRFENRSQRIFYKWHLGLINAKGRETLFNGIERLLDPKSSKITDRSFTDLLESKLLVLNNVLRFPDKSDPTTEMTFFDDLRID